jgi:signal transduction histidine kinase
LGNGEIGSNPGAGLGRGRGLLLAAEAFLARRSRAFVLSTAGVLVAGIAATDVLTGSDLSLSLFYLLPVALVTWRLGRAAGIALAGAAALGWTVSEVLTSADAGSFPPVWNALVRFGVLDVVATLLDALRTRMRDERELTRRAIESADALRSLNELKDTILHAVSHDLRGPIAAIVGSAQSLERRGELGLTGGDEEALVDGILQSGRKMNRMVSDLLDLERLDLGLVEPDRAPTDLGALVHRVVDEALYADRHPVHVEIFESLEMDVDAGKVERILENLLVNAVRHTPARTPIHVRADRVEGGVLLSVDDEGPGVPEELKTAIFEPFRQGAPGSSGAGIGLSLVARFSELHGGRAWVEDRPGGGAAFRVFLPGSPRTGSKPESLRAASR